MFVLRNVVLVGNKFYKIKAGCFLIFRENRVMQVINFLGDRVIGIEKVLTVPTIIPNDPSVLNCLANGNKINIKVNEINDFAVTEEYTLKFTVENVSGCTQASK